MATLVENRICNACGAEVRPKSLFCYNCGSSVAPEVVVALKDKKDFTGEENGNKLRTVGQAIADESADAPIPKPDLPNETNLKSAAAMRRKPKSFQPKLEKIIWEEHENAPNVWFLLVALVLTLFAAGVFYLAVYLK